jgi:hypothetical protein
VTVRLHVSGQSRGQTLARSAIMDASPGRALPRAMIPAIAQSWHDLNHRRSRFRGAPRKWRSENSKEGPPARG